MALAEIIDALVGVERDVLPQVQIYSDLPENVHRLPAILNVPGNGTIEYGQRDVTYLIHHAVDVTVLISRADQPASYRQAVSWIEVLRAALDRDHTLGGSAFNSGVSEYRLGSTTYAAVTYVSLIITVRADELVIAGEVGG